jgi:hypothetical protein
MLTAKQEILAGDATYVMLEAENTIIDAYRRENAELKDKLLAAQEEREEDLEFARADERQKCWESLRDRAPLMLYSEKYGRT